MKFKGSVWIGLVWIGFGYVSIFGLVRFGLGRFGIPSGIWLIGYSIKTDPPTCWIILHSKQLGSKKNGKKIEWRRMDAIIEAVEIIGTGVWRAR